MNRTTTGAAGAAHGEEMPPEDREAMIRAAGRTPKQRSTLYEDVAEDRTAVSFIADELSPVVLPRALRYERSETPRGPLSRPGLDAAE